MKKDIQKRGSRPELPTPICSESDCLRRGLRNLNRCMYSSRVILLCRLVYIPESILVIFYLLWNRGVRRELERGSLSLKQLGLLGWADASGRFRPMSIYQRIRKLSNNYHTFQSYKFFPQNVEVTRGMGASPSR